MSSPSPSSRTNSARRRRKRAKSLPSFGTTSPKDDTSRALSRATSCPPSFSLARGPVDQNPLEKVDPKLKHDSVRLAENPARSTQADSGNEDDGGVQTNAATHPTISMPTTQGGNQGPDLAETSRKNASADSADKIHRVRVEPERTGWTRLSDMLRQKERDKIEDVKEDIDTLLVFAGLFSAVITAFIIESYRSLQQQPEDITAQALVQISKQLASLSINGNLINSTIPSVTSSFTAPRFSVQINTLWSLSLVIALITASLGILVKQWFHEYMARDTQDPQKQVKILLFRNVGMTKWQVFEISAFLPVFLQLALLLFFIGLSLFLHELNSTVGWITTSLMLVWAGVLFLTAIAPAFSPQCPYKTPMLKGFMARVRSLWILRTSITAIYHKIPVDWVTIRSFFKSLNKWSQAWHREREAFEEDQVSKDDTSDLSVILCLKNILQGEKLDETILSCFQGLGIQDLCNRFRGFWEKHNHVERGMIPGIPEAVDVDNGRKLFSTVLVDSQHLVTDVGDSCNPSTFRDSYQGLTDALSKSYDPIQNYPIPSTSLPAFIRLIQGDRTSAAFAILTMYSIRVRTMIKHPNEWDNLFLSQGSYGTDDQFISNLLVATKTLIHSLWNRQQPESDIQQIADCVAAIRHDTGDSDPAVTPDPIAFIYVFAAVLNRLTSSVVVRKHRERIFEVMGELAEILTDLDGSSWSYSRKQCAEDASLHLYFCDLEDEKNLRPKLRTLIKTWDPDWRR